MLLKNSKVVLLTSLIFLIILLGWKIYCIWQVKQWQSELYLSLWQIASEGNCENAEINSFFDSERNNGVNFSWWTSKNRPARSLLLAFIFCFGPRKDVCGYTDYDQYINMYEENEKLERKE